jgi:GntR family transcriptional regulator/MocR family aminotransferase
MEPIFELAIALPAKGSRDLLRALHRQLRDAILDGRLQAGLRMPPTRKLAASLGVSRNTAIAAYDLLLSEGYLVARTGAGSHVADVRPRLQRPRAPAGNPSADRRLAEFWRKHAGPAEATPEQTSRFDFRTGFPDITQFPFEIWQRLSARASRALSRKSAVEGVPQGTPALREAIANHVSFARAVACDSEDIVVTAGTRQAVDLLARILVTPGKTEVALEDPGYPPVRDSFAAAGARILTVPVDGEGLVVERLPVSARVVCVTPSHQFPLGVAMSARRRAALLEFAQAYGAVVIEDDYDSEFRVEGRPLDALQTLDRAESVFYVGTFSKCMFPALRLGFVVAPPWARRALVAAKQSSDWHSPVIAQDALAAFIAEGHLARHIRKMRKVYGERHAALLLALARHCGDRLRPIPALAGVHLAAELVEPGQAGDMVAAAAEAGIKVESLARYSHRRSAPGGLVLGYGMIGAGDIDPGIRALSRSWPRSRRGAGASARAT